MHSRASVVLALLVALGVIVASGYGLGQEDEGASPVRAAQPLDATWQSAMLWRPSLAEAGNALAELVNQIDASCRVDVNPVEATHGAGPEGPVYALTVTWACSDHATNFTGATWQSEILWRPTLGEAGEALAELINQFDAACWVDVNPVTATNGAPPEGSVYAFAVTWACPDAPPTTGSTLAPAAVVARDFAFEPFAITISANSDVSVSLSNMGEAPHNFSIDELGISVDLAPGETTTVTVNALAGTYEFYCNVPGHRDLGMVGTLTAE